MKRDEFVNQCFSRGYAYRHERKQVQEWCKKYPKDEYTEYDFIELYRYVNSCKLGSNWPSSKWETMAGGGRTARRHHDRYWEE